MARKISEQERKFSDEIFRLRSMNDLDGAIMECDKALEYFGQFNFFHKIKGDLLYEKRDFDGALDSYLAFLERIKGEPEYFTNFSRFFLKLHHVKKIQRNVYERLAKIVVQEDYTYILCKGILKLILDTYEMPCPVKQAVQRGQQPITNIRYAIQLFYMRRKKDQKTVGAEEQELLDGVLRQTERVGKLLNRFSPQKSGKRRKAWDCLLCGIFSNCLMRKSMLMNLIRMVPGL